MTLSPQRKRDGQGLDTCPAPPRGFVAMSVDLAVMEPADWHGELVADLAPERTGLGKAQVMGIGRRTTAHEARLGRDEPAVLLVAQPDCLCGDAAAADLRFIGGSGRLPSGL